LGGVEPKISTIGAVLSELWLENGYIYIFEMIHHICDDFGFWDWLTCVNRVNNGKIRIKMGPFDAQESI
jgi:hypothetical protein